MFSIRFSRFAPHSLALLRWIALALLLVPTSGILVHENDSQIASAADVTAPQKPTRNRWTRAMRVDSNSLQTVGLLLSIREKLYEIGEKQKQDGTPSRISNDLDVISHRLQNVEEQISRAESYNKMRLEQLMESAMKSEFLIDQLTRRVEKNHQSINNRLSELDNSLEKAAKTQQENAEKIIHKIEMQRDHFANMLPSPRTTVPPTLTPVPSQVMTQTQQSFDLDNTADEIENVSDDDFGEGNNADDENNNDGAGVSSNDTSLLKIVVATKRLVLTDVQKFLKNQSDRIVLEMDEKYSQLQRQAVFLNSSLEECVSLTNKIYAKLADQKFDATHYFDNFIESLIVQINSQNVRNIDKLKIIVKNSTDAVLHQQRIFASNCRRLQSNEEQMEDKVVAILQNLYDYIDNQNERSQRYFEMLADSQQTCDFVRDLIGQNSSRTVIKVQSEQVTDQFQRDIGTNNMEQAPSISNTDIFPSESVPDSIATSPSPTDAQNTSEGIILKNSASFDAGDTDNKWTTNTGPENVHFTFGGGNRNAGDSTILGAASDPQSQSRSSPAATSSAVESRVNKTSDLYWIKVEDSSSSNEYDHDNQNQLVAPHNLHD